MSTICKLDPRIRQARTRRKTLIETLYREAMDQRRPPVNRLAVHAIANELHAIRKASNGDSARKEARFKVVINRPTFQSPV
jgi:hypothetical protein